MNTIINESLIDLSLSAGDKKAAITKLAEQIHQDARLNDFDAYIEEVFRREELSTTGIGFGVGIPHGKTDAVKVPTVAFGRSAEGIEWESLDEKPVHMVFLIAVPEAAASNAHLKILAALSRRLMKEDFRQELMNSKDESALLGQLNEIFEAALQS